MNHDTRSSPVLNPVLKKKKKKKKEKKERHLTSKIGQVSYNMGWASNLGVENTGI